MSDAIWIVGVAVAVAAFSAAAWPIGWGLLSVADGLRAIARAIADRKLP